MPGRHLVLFTSLATIRGPGTSPCLSVRRRFLANLKRHGPFLGKFHQVDWYSVTLLGPRSPRRMDVGNERAFESITCIVELGDLA
jgi:hypothetical protein